MQGFVIFRARWLMISLLVLLVAIVGCSSGDKTEVETAAETAEETAASVGETAESAVEDVTDTLAVLANPEPGVDPVCKMKIDGGVTIEIDGKKYGFCSQECADKFKEDPAKYLAVVTEEEE